MEKCSGDYVDILFSFLITINLHAISVWSEGVPLVFSHGISIYMNLKIKHTNIINSPDNSTKTIGFV